jgi:hypothetical protein
MDNNHDFSQFDRDNMNRLLTAAYINQANAVLAKIYASPRAGRVTGKVLAADTKAGEALVRYQAMDYLGALTWAHEAYELVLGAAVQIAVPVEPQSWQADYRARGVAWKFIDTANPRRLDFSEIMH